MNDEVTMKLRTKWVAQYAVNTSDRYTHLSFQKLLDGYIKYITSELRDII